MVKSEVTDLNSLGHAWSVVCSLDNVDDRRRLSERRRLTEFDVTIESDSVYVSGIGASGLWGCENLWINKGCVWWKPAIVYGSMCVGVLVIVLLVWCLCRCRGDLEAQDNRRKVKQAKYGVGV